EAGYRLTDVWAKPWLRGGQHLEERPVCAVVRVGVARCAVDADTQPGLRPDVRQAIARFDAVCPGALGQRLPVAELPVAVRQAIHRAGPERHDVHEVGTDGVDAGRPSLVRVQSG